MALVKASLKLFGGDTVIVRCSERCHIHLMSEKKHVKDTQTDILSVQNRDNAWLTVPYTGVWNTPSVISQPDVFAPGFRGNAQANPGLNPLSG